ncbi:glycosyltransferase family 15 protein [Seminavis robusta]|uniref:Glycosyltransferase family 15 protein n=1 Tax=Seminavis robusta TaxID=568900 RepID=A0A9N8EGB5_9STRA|nr:glycosyltransferase family 15 protein [Seminavis robusta]|eukprot:Sro949_g223720.1 glycosyltransferase family 15 protein (523) ;mRNA; f:38041-39609
MATVTSAITRAKPSVSASGLFRSSWWRTSHQVLFLLSFWACLSIIYYLVFWQSSSQTSIVPVHDTVTTEAIQGNVATNNHNHPERGVDVVLKYPDYCQHYDGVLLISQGDRNGAAGTIFYLFILNQLLYAEQHNLQPWIHLNSVSRHVYDHHQHATYASSSTEDTSITYQFTEELQLTWEHFQDPLLPNKTFPYPGTPVYSSSPSSNNDNKPVSITVHGSGVWNSYFQSIVPLQLSKNNDQTAFVTHVDITKPCPNKPLLRFQSDLILVKGLHLHCPYCVRAWKYGGVPPSLKLPSNNYLEWWAPMRETGHRIVSTYYQLLPSLQQQQQFDSSKNQKCMAVHIRHSDKANKRTKIPLAAFLPYCQAYLEENSNDDVYIYVATDSSRVLDKIQTEWPEPVQRHVRWQDHVIRSPNGTAVFEQAFLQQQQQQGSTSSSGHHRTNTEVLVDIAAMARCDWIVHGLSAVSEAAIYTHPTMFRDHAINLEFYQYYKRRRRRNNATDPDAPPSIEAFRAMLRQQERGL